MHMLRVFSLPTGGTFPQPLCQRVRFKGFVPEKVSLRSESWENITDWDWTYSANRVFGLCKGQSANWATLPPYTAETGRSRWSELMCVTRLNQTWFPKPDTAGWRRCRWDERQKTRWASWCYSIGVFWLVDKVMWWHLARGEFRGEASSTCYQLGLSYVIDWERKPRAIVFM